jgi:hypothetical protein
MTGIPAEVVSDFTDRESMARLYDIAKSQVARAWGSGAGQLLGPVLHRALVAEELMRIIAAQDQALSAGVIRRLVDRTWELLNTDPDFQAGTEH